VDPGSGNVSGSPAAAGLPGIGGYSHASAILTTTSGTVTNSATQVLSSPAAGRRRVVVVNNESGAGTYLYVGHDSGITASTLWRARLDATERVELDIGPGVSVYLFGDAGGTDYTVYEEAWHVS